MWHDDWDGARAKLEAWWEGKGCALDVRAPKDEPWEVLPIPPPPETPEQMWTDVQTRVDFQMAQLGQLWYGGAAFPYLDTELGPGSLGLFLGCEPGFAWNTVWYEPCLENLETPIRMDPENRWFQLHLDFRRRAIEAAQGRVLVGIPDLIENLDTLAQMRGPQELMFDLVEEPDLAKQRIAEITDAFCQAFDALAVRDEWGGTCFAAFHIWSPGRCAKLQCDANTMISPAMFREFVVPELERQAAWLDRSMFHLDGEQATVHLDALLEMPSLDAIEWTPVHHDGGDPKWYDLYRRIKAGGKRVQAIDVRPDQVMPLLDAVGPEGMFLTVWADSEAEGRSLVRQVYGEG